MSTTESNVTKEDIEMLWNTISKYMQTIEHQTLMMDFRQRLNPHHPDDVREHERLAMVNYHSTLWQTVKLYYCQHRDELSSHILRNKDNVPPYWVHCRSTLERILDEEATTALENALS